MKNRKTMKGVSTTFTVFRFVACQYGNLDCVWIVQFVKYLNCLNCNKNVKIGRDSQKMLKFLRLSKLTRTAKIVGN